MSHEFGLQKNSSITIHTPEGVILVSSLNGVGTQVMVYRNPDHSPVGIIHLEPKEPDGQEATSRT